MMQCQKTTRTDKYAEKIATAKRLLQEADRVVIGVGAGLSASAGLSYIDPKLAAKWFPEYASLGAFTIQQIQALFWRANGSEPEAYWGYWARHIWHMRYEQQALAPYTMLRNLIGEKKHFICSTNVDGQLVKAGFDEHNIFAPQGDYALFQCATPCSNELYPNREMVDRMIANMPNPLEIATEDVPKCPKCGALLVPNLRCDDRFVEESHMENYEPYQQFVAGCQGRPTVFFELGVGFNTPTIIRLPFEAMVTQLDAATLIRVNLTDSSVYFDVPKGKVVPIEADIATVLSALSDGTAN